jgi:hypothetical protein
MKRLFLFISFLLLINAMAGAQKPKKVWLQKNKNTADKVLPGKKAKVSDSSTAGGATISLTSISENKALKNSEVQLQISDPILRAFNANANGANIKLGSSGLPGVPKGTYGFANGKIILYSNGYKSSGTITGMASVGTGTSPGTIGSLGPVMGENGKSPYAGMGPFGTRIPLVLKPLIDTTGNKRLLK